MFNALCRQIIVNAHVIDKYVGENQQLKLQVGQLELQLGKGSRFDDSSQCMYDLQQYCNSSGA